LGEINADNKNALKTIDLTGKPKRVYFININLGKESFSRKIVVQ